MGEASDNTHRFPSEGQEVLTFLAHGFEFQGTLIFDGTARIDGSVSGEIRSTGTVILGEHAIVEGEVSAGTIVSGGTIRGTVRATGKIHLLQTAVLRGNVAAPLVQMDEGVSFYGTCEADGCVEHKNPDGLRADTPSALTIRLAHHKEVR